MAGRLHELTGPEIRDRISAESIVLVPIGAIEQHGPHLPLVVDHLIADSVANAVVDRAGADLDCWMIPTLPFSKSDEHAWSAGTMWLSRDTTERILDEIAERVAAMGVRRIVFLNGHGGNSTMLNVACREARRHHGLLTFLVHPFPPPAYSPPSETDTGELGMGIHGGHDETSVMLHLRPDLVHLERAERNVPEWLAENDHVRFGVRPGSAGCRTISGPRATSVTRRKRRLRPGPGSSITPSSTCSPRSPRSQGSTFLTGRTER